MPSSLDQHSATTTTHKCGGTILYAACGADVFVNARPLPNEIDIGGEAVAVNCLDYRAGPPR